MKKCKINQLNLEISHPIDVLIGCVSYEQRCLSGATALKKINIQYTIYFRVKEKPATPQSAGQPFSQESRSTRPQSVLVF